MSIAVIRTDWLRAIHQQLAGSNSVLTARVQSLLGDRAPVAGHNSGVVDEKAPIRPFDASKEGVQQQQQQYMQVTGYGISVRKDALELV